jgi:hypothetical protein
MLRIQPGKFYRIKNSDKKSAASDHYNMIVVENNEGGVEELLFTDSDLVKATVRRKKNTEDIPRYSIVAPEGGIIYVIGLTTVGIVSGLVGYFIRDLNLF